MLTLLCVDDEVAGLNVRKLFLESVGYKVLTATDGQQALEIFSQGSIDAVILDYRMPGMNGGEVAARMRKINPAVPIILYSAYLSLSADALDSADAFVTKGQSPTVLLAELDSLLDRAHAHPDFEGEYVAFANRSRRYVRVSEGFCRLLGYSREEMLHMSIDELAATPSEVSERWEQYIVDGKLQGEITLRDRSGALVPMAFSARVFPDGCMVSRMEPLKPPSQGPERVSGPNPERASGAR
jgi:CheY-like chemotaxis protein